VSGVLGDVPHQKTGATALHVAAAKGYIKVISLLIQAGAQVNTQVMSSLTHSNTQAFIAGIFFVSFAAFKTLNLKIQACRGGTVR
jgi:ankyrin repeat protein